MAALSYTYSRNKQASLVLSRIELAYFLCFFNLKEKLFLFLIYFWKNTSFYLKGLHILHGKDGVFSQEI